MNASPARAEVTFPTRRRPTLGRGRQRRTCHDCERSWPRSARYCGRCGRHIHNQGGSAAGPGPARAGTAARRTGPRWLLAAGAFTILGSVGLLTTLVPTLLTDTTTATDHGVRVPPPGPAGGVEVLVPQVPSAAGTEVQPTCLRSSRAGGPCGPTLTQASARATATPLHSSAVLLIVGGELSRVDLPEGDVAWRTTVFEPAGDVRVHASDDDVVVTHNREVARIDAQTGDVRWISDVGTTGPRVAPRAWVVDDDVLTLDAAGMLSALDGATGAIRWSSAGMSTEAVITPHGLLVAQRGTLGLWHPQSDQPRWSRSGASLATLRLPSGVRAVSPVRLLATRELVDVADGRTVPIPHGGPSAVRMLGELTLVLRWPGNGPDLEITAIGPGGDVAWQQTDLPVACCLAESVFTAGSQIAIGSSTGSSVVLDRDDGSIRGWLERDGATLAGVAGDLVVWRDDLGIVGTDRASGREAFRASGRIVSLDPLLLAGPTGLVHVTPGGLAPPQPPRSSLSRTTYK